MQRLKDAHTEWQAKDRNNAYLVQGGLLAELRESWAELKATAKLAVELTDFFGISDTHEQRSEQLLVNILPLPIATRLKQGRGTIADHFAEVTVLFANIVEFTQFSEHLSAQDLIALLNDIFSQFDHLAERHQLEKIKTIGDAYMAVGGIPVVRADHAQAVADMALDMQRVAQTFSDRIGQSFRLRIGINTGTVVSGVIGTKKFVYDLWGDTVKIASRMEVSGVPAQIQVTEATYNCLHHTYDFDSCDGFDIESNIPTYFLRGKKS